MRLFLGLDTSCYTTSAAVFNEAGRFLGASRKLLTVPAGKRGLSQSEMVFQHTRNLPVVLKSALQSLSETDWAAVAASIAPRPVADSYMPAFLVGKGMGEAIALSHEVPFYGLSHQENHIYAGLVSAEGLTERAFLAVHASGGTTDILKVVRPTKASMSIEQLNSTLDISAGQFIDRIGVKLGLAFPAGPHLEALAKTSELSGGQENLPIVCRPNGVSFAGPETALTKWIQAGRNSSDIAAAAQWIVARTLGRMIEREALATGLQDVLLVGGVMSNQFIRSYIEGFLMKRRLSLRLFFAKPEFSSDHALGAAFFASLRHSL